MRGLLLLLISIPLFAVDAPFTIKEFSNIARTNEPAFCGISFKRGECTNLSQLALFSGATEIPAQFSRLVRFEDGSYQWVLCDFTDNYSAKQEKTYTVKTQTPGASPSTVISVTRAGSVVEINNGPLKFQIDTVNFNGIQSLHFNGTQIINGTTGGFSATDDVAAQTYRNGAVTAAKFIYLGPLRATYRVEGTLYNGGACGGLGYSYMVTAYAGSPRLRVELSLRNSINATCGRYAKVSRSFAGFPLAFTPQVVSGAATDVKAYENGSVGVCVTDKWAGGLYPGSLHNQLLNGNTVEVDIIKTGGAGDGYQTGLYWLPDRCNKNSEIILDFYSGTKTTGDLANLALAAKSKLVGRPDPAYLSATGGLSAGHFGTLEDEKACYGKWGWSYSSWRTTTFNQPDTNPQPNAAVPWEDIHYEAETDDAEGLMLQWIRTGYRGLWDIGEAWSRYYKVNYPFRTLGFADQGEDFAAAYVSQYATRTSQSVSGAPGYWSNWGISRVDVVQWTGCHFFGVGALDYYCLTGDIDALEGAMDLGETAWLFSRPGNRGDTLNSTNGGDRATGRQLLLLSRLYEVLRDSTSRFRAQHRAKMVFRSKHRDPRGFLYGTPALWSNWDEEMTAQTGMPDSLKQFIAANNITLTFDQTNVDTAWVHQGANKWFVKAVGGSWEQTYCQMGVERYYRATDDEDARDYIIGFAQYAQKHVAYKCGIVPYTVDFDFPRKGDLFYPGDFTNWNPAHNVCVNNHSTTPNSLGSHSGWYTVYYPGVCALGYRYTGDPSLLNKAREFWDLGSKREYQTTNYFAGPNQVGYFAYHNPPKDDGLLNTHHLFFETLHHGDTVPPAAVADLSVSRNGSGGLIFSWGAPGDNNGTVAEYQLKLSKGHSIVDYQAYNFAADDTNKAPFWYAQNVKGEPLPAAQGTPQGFSVAGSFLVSETWYAALCSRDASGNLSPLSNVVTIDNTIGVETFEQAVPPAALSVLPNPASGAAVVRALLGRGSGSPLRLSIYDVAGRKVRSFEPVREKGFSHDWRLSGGNALPSGLYIAKLTVDGQRFEKKFTLMK